VHAPAAASSKLIDRMATPAATTGRDPGANEIGFGGAPA
jgi:hypothetical protein